MQVWLLDLVQNDYKLIQNQYVFIRCIRITFLYLHIFPQAKSTVPGILIPLFWVEGGRENYQIKNKTLNQMKENSLKMTVWLLLKLFIYTSIKENKFQMAFNCSKAEVRILCSFLF